MYSSIYELPSQVTASLDNKDAKVWMDTYNNLDPHTESEIKSAKKKAWMACKDLPSSFSFKIKASVDAIDKDREIIDLDSIKKHMDSYIDYGGPICWEHGDYQVANCWDWEPFTKDGMDGIYVWGNVFGGDRVYDQMRESFVKGKNSLSVAGEADSGHYQCDSRGCYVRRDVKQLMEISLCAVPANKFCKMEWYNEKAKLTKSASVQSDMRFRVDEYELHKTYRECPMLGLKKSLQDIGYETHATEAGVFIKITKSDFMKALPYMHANNLHAIWVGGDKACINDGNYLAEMSFKNGLRDGYIDSNGYVTSKITKSQFEMLYDRDVLMDCDGKLRIRCPSIGH